MTRRTLLESILADVVIAVADCVGLAAFGMAAYGILWIMQR